MNIISIQSDSECHISIEMVGLRHLFVILSTMPDKTFEFVFSKLTLTDWF